MSVSQLIELVSQIIEIKTEWLSLSTSVNQIPEPGPPMSVILDIIKILGEIDQNPTATPSSNEMKAIVAQLESVSECLAVPSQIPVPSKMVMADNEVIAVAKQPQVNGASVRPLTDIENTTLSTLWRHAIQVPPTLLTHENTKMTLSKDVLRLLNDGGWLNNGLVDWYMELLTRREEDNKTKRPRCCFYNSSAYTKVSRDRDQAYDIVCREKNESNIFDDRNAYDRVFIPIVNAQHWTLVMIDNKTHIIYYYDSLVSPMKQPRAIVIRDWVMAECKKFGLNVQWNIQIPIQSAHQVNGYDCGVYVCRYAECLARDGDMAEFAHANMTDGRSLLAYEILTKQVVHLKP